MLTLIVNKLLKFATKFFLFRLINRKVIKQSNPSDSIVILSQFRRTN